MATESRTQTPAVAVRSNAPASNPQLSAAQGLGCRTYRVTVVYSSGRVWRAYGLSLWDAIETKEATMQQPGAVAGYCIPEQERRPK